MGKPSAVVLLYQKEKTNHIVCKQLMQLLMLYLNKRLALIMEWTITFSDYINLPSWAIATNRPTEALAFVISFAFVYSHHKHSKYLGRELNHGPTDCFSHKLFLVTALPSLQCHKFKNKIFGSRLELLYVFIHLRCIRNFDFQGFN